MLGVSGVFGVFGVAGWPSKSFSKIVFTFLATSYRTLAFS